MANNKKSKNGYFYYLRKSFIDIRNNPVILIPSLIMQILSYFFIYFAMQGSRDKFNLFVYTYETTPFLFNLFNTHFLFFLILFFIIFFLVTIYFSAGLIGMCREIVLKKKTSLKTMFGSGNLYFKKLLYVYLLIFFVLILPVLVLFSIMTLLIGFVGTGGTAVFLSMLLAALFFFAFLIYAVIIAIALAFIYPVISASQKISPWKTIAKSAEFAKNNLSKTVITLLVTLLVWIVLFTIIFGSMFLLKVQGPPFSTVPRVQNLVIFQIIYYVLQVAVSTAILLLWFNIYFNKK